MSSYMGALLYPCIFACVMQMAFSSAPAVGNGGFPNVLPPNIPNPAGMVSPFLQEGAKVMEPLTQTARIALDTKANAVGTLFNTAASVPKGFAPVANSGFDAFQGTVNTALPMFTTIPQQGLNGILGATGNAVGGFGDLASGGLRMFSSMIPGAGAGQLPSGGGAPFAGPIGAATGNPFGALTPPFAGQQQQQPFAPQQFAQVPPQFAQVPQQFAQVPQQFAQRPPQAAQAAQVAPQATQLPPQGTEGAPVPPPNVPGVPAPNTPETL